MRTPLKINPNDTPAPRAANRQDWIDIAGRVINHEFRGADSSTIESLTIGLHGTNTIECKRALRVLKEYKERLK